MMAAQVKYGRAVQVGQWQRSQPHMVDALNFIKTGKLGKIRTVKAWAGQREGPFTTAGWAGGDVLTGLVGDWLLQYAPDDYRVVENASFQKVYRRV